MEKTEPAVPLEIRRARSDEGKILGGIGFAAWRDSALGQADGGRTAHDGLLAIYVDFCETRWQHVLVAERDGGPVGWGARENGDNVISDLWVAPKAQGQGIGSALLAALEDEVRGAGHQNAELEVNVVNADALRLYRRNGYSVIWRGEKFAPALGYIIEKMRLSKRLEG